MHEVLTSNQTKAQFLNVRGLVYLEGDRGRNRWGLNSDGILLYIYLYTVFIHFKGALGYKTHPKLSKTIVTSKRNENFT